ESFGGVGGSVSRSGTSPASSAPERDALANDRPRQEAQGVGIHLAGIVCMPRVGYTAQVTLRARQSGGARARLLDELLGDRPEQWTLVIRESFEDPDLRIHLRREQGEVAS